MTASVTESQISSPPRMIGTRRSRVVRLALAFEAAPEHLLGRPRRAPRRQGRPVISSAARFQSTTLPSRSTATIPSAMLARIAKLRSFSIATRW